MNLCGCEFELVGAAATYGLDRVPTKGVVPTPVRGKTSPITHRGKLLARIGDVAKEGAAELAFAPDEREC